MRSSARIGLAFGELVRAHFTATLFWAQWVGIRGAFGHILITVVGAFSYCCGRT